MPRRKGRKNPLPQRLCRNLDMDESIALDAKADVYPDPNLKLPENPEERMAVLEQMPITSLYKENDSESFKHVAQSLDGKFVCPKCNKDYTTPNGIRYHMTMSCPKICRYKYTCLICGTSFPLIEEITSHITVIHVPSDASRVNTRVRKPNQNDIGSLCEEEEDLNDALKQMQDEDPSYSADEEYVVNENDFLSADEEVYAPLDLSMKKDGTKKTSKRKLKKKSKKAKSKETVGSRGALSFAKLDQPLVEVMPWFHTVMCELESSFRDVHPMLMPNHNDYEASVPPHEFFFCGPQLACSPPFRILQEVGNKKSRKPDTICSELKAFSALPVDEHCSGLNLNFWAAGPVWAMSWCPDSIKNAGSKQYLAVSTHNGLHKIGSCYEEPGLIQLWDCGHLGLHCHHEETPKMALGLSHYDAPIWDLKWCPLGGRRPQSKESRSTLSRIGVLAAACGSGKVLILSVPDPDEISEPLISNNAQDGRKLFRLVPAMILLPASLISDENSDQKNANTAFGQCMCVDWSISDGGQQLVAGYSTGLVAIWKVHEPSPLLLSQEVEFEPPKLVAVRVFRAHSKAVRGISWCPYKENVFATGGMDRYLKMWDRDYVEAPINESNWKGSIYMELNWPMLWCGVYASTDEVFAGPCYHGAIYHDALQKYLCPTAVIPFKSICCSVTSSNWMNCIAGCDAMGQLVVHACSNWSRKTQCKKFIPRILMFSTSVQWNHDETSGDEETMNTSCGGDPSLNTMENKYKLVFTDTNMADLDGCENRRCCKDVKLYDGFPSTCCDKPLVQSINRVCWNPNFGSHTWIASGMQSGLIRLHCVDAMHSSEMDTFYYDHVVDIR